MAYRVAWSPRAVEDLESIAQYIASDSPAYAATVVKTILSTGRALSNFPLAGRVVPELADESIREINNHGYVFYLTKQQKITAFIPCGPGVAWVARRINALQSSPKHLAVSLISRHRRLTRVSR